MNDSEEITRLKDSIDGLLALEVLDALEKISRDGCTLQSILGGKPCGKCAPCITKPLEERLRLRHVKAHVRGKNTADDLHTFWEALHAINSIAEHVEVPDKKVNSTRRKAAFTKILDGLETIRETADTALREVQYE